MADGDSSLPDQPQQPHPVVDPIARNWRWRRSVPWMAVEVVLISASVFLGLAGQQWLENRQHREQAKETLRRFREELATNRTEIATKLGYHRTLAEKLRPWVRTDPAQRGEPDIDFAGLQPPFFRTTAWDLALATQSLGDLDHELAFAISGIYMLQRLIDQQTQAMTQAMFLRPPWENGPAFLMIVEPYYSDLISIEPNLLEMYDAVLPQIDATLAD